MTKRDEIVKITRLLNWDAVVNKFAVYSMADIVHYLDHFYPGDNWGTAKFIFREISNCLFEQNGRYGKHEYGAPTE